MVAEKVSKIKVFMGHSCSFYFSEIASLSFEFSINCTKDLVMLFISNPRILSIAPKFSFVGLICIFADRSFTFHWPHPTGLPNVFSKFPLDF